MNFKQTGLKKWKSVNGVNSVDVSFKNSLEADFQPPQFISVRGDNKKTFLFELQEINDLEGGLTYAYKKINLLGGFGVNEYNPNGEVTTSLFEDNNLKATELSARRNIVNTRKNPFVIPEEGITIIEMQELFNSANLPNTPEIRKLRNIIESLKDFIDPQVKVLSKKMDKGPGVYNSSTNTITLDPSQFDGTTIGRYYRVFAEEVTHSLTSREIDRYLDRRNTINVKEGEVSIVLSEKTPICYHTLNLYNSTRIQ